MEQVFTIDWMVGLLTLTTLELVLGIDNIVLISILVEKLPDNQKDSARKLGLALALLGRIVLLFGAVWLTKLTAPLFEVFSREISIRDLIMIIGGLFLLAKATTEIFNFVEARDNEHSKVKMKVSYSSVISQIIVFDVIFSLDSVLTAVGLSKHLSVMVISVMVAIGVMLIFAKSIGEFVKENPAIKLLALSFLVMIGVMLLADGFGTHFERGYVYFAMAFSLFVELLNKRRRNKLRPST